MNFEIAKNQQKYFMCPSCYRVISGKYSSSIDIYTPTEVYGDDELIDKKNLHVYNDTHNNVSIPCPYCNDDSVMFEIDRYMIDPIRFLNEKGYYTKFCCEGHISPKYTDTSESKAIEKCEIVDSIPYIGFDWNKIAHRMYSTMTDSDDYEFFYFNFRREFTLFKTDIIQTKHGLVWAPEGWVEDLTNYGNDFQIDTMYYRGNKTYGDTAVSYEVDDTLENINYGIEERKKKVEKAKALFSDEAKEDYINNKLLNWIAGLPDLYEIKSKDDLFKAFDL